MLGFRTPKPHRVVLESEHIGVSGERHHAEALRQLLTSYAGGRLEYKCVATLRHDRLNESDPNAVEVSVHNIRVGYISRKSSEVVLARIGDHEVQIKCSIHWNGELINGIYHVKLFPLF